ncbi:phosphate acyltransferase PlsX [Streptococcus pantholopis]|uniref:Phosphate acyltransferase n=1 Tax=Streptococcus pantholopis TaxID=1811193 RepID=A0A172Q9X6_9STRE|nr:phosphate acyltransferase PlsX [Streptococcus pantholopis]AND80264.1 phosphate acyltransferase [Streptococcus pantholopis]
MKKIAVDAMGGDNAPQAIVEGVNRALAEFKDIEIELYGDEAKIKDYLTATERVTIQHTDEKIDSDDEPAKAVRRKKKASMVVGAQAVKEKKVQALISAGNTGALLAAGLFVVGRIKGIDRPGLLSTLPTADGRGVDMLDLGANAENTAHHLHQYAVLGSFYAENVRSVVKPRVGLLNNGTESTKGDPIRKEAYSLLSADKTLNFIGNIEARELMNGVADVVVADGFTGNAVLKTMEGTGLSIMGVLKEAVKTGGFKAKLGAFFLKDSLYHLRDLMDYSAAGGAVLFGLKAPVVKCHGSSDAKSVYYTIKQVRTMLETDVVSQLTEVFTSKED